MAMLIADPRLEEQLKAQRRAWGADHHDEVWEGVYFTAPLPNNEHQELVADLTAAFHAVVKAAGLGKVFPGVNLAGCGDNWEHDYRAPDVIVFLKQTAAEDHDTYWRGAADFVVEIVSHGDRTYEKLPFYARLGVRELLIVSRDPWTLELYRHQGGELVKVATSTLAPAETEQASVRSSADVLTSAVLPLQFQLIAGQLRPKIEITHAETGQQWVA